MTKKPGLHKIIYRFYPTIPMTIIIYILSLIIRLQSIGIDLYAIASKKIWALSFFGVAYKRIKINHPPEVCLPAQIFQKMKEFIKAIVKWLKAFFDCDYKNFDMPGSIADDA